MRVTRATFHLETSELKALASENTARTNHHRRQSDKKRIPKIKSLVHDCTPTKKKREAKNKNGEKKKKSL